MKIDVKEKPRKMVLIWLSVDEANDRDLMHTLEEKYGEWKNQGYLPVVFKSGTGNLEDSMYLLMKHNYEVYAQKNNLFP
ncbi:MAG: hypothetical protein IKL16_05410 [Clostridia bacterium]|nr:hypothetical protein [Clostridia bacterium]